MQPRVIKCPICGEVFSAGGMVATRGLELHIMQKHPEFYNFVKKNLERRPKRPAKFIKLEDGTIIYQTYEIVCRKCKKTFPRKYEAILHIFKEHWKR